VQTRTFPSFKTNLKYLLHDLCVVRKSDRCSLCWYERDKHARTHARTTFQRDESHSDARRISISEVCETKKNGVFWDVTPCKTPFFEVTAVKTSNLTYVKQLYDFPVTFGLPSNDPTSNILYRYKRSGFLIKPMTTKRAEWRLFKVPMTFGSFMSIIVLRVPQHAVA
jgi:hypothetical protein